MALQERLENKLRQHREYTEVATDSIRLIHQNMGYQAYEDVLRCAEILVKAKKELSILDAEILSLREAIIEEAKEDLL